MQSHHPIRKSWIIKVGELQENFLQAGLSLPSYIRVAQKLESSPFGGRIVVQSMHEYKYHRTAGSGKRSYSLSGSIPLRCRLTIEKFPQTRCYMSHVAVREVEPRTRICGEMVIINDCLSLVEGSIPFIPAIE